MGDLLGVELPCAREHAERGGGAGLAGSIAGENWHNPIEPRSFLPAESLALHQPSGMARPGSLSIAWKLGFLFLVICSSYWTQTQQLWREQAFIAAHQSCLWLGQRETGKGSIHTLNLLGSGPGTEAAPAQSCVCTAGLWKGALPQCSHPSIPSPPIYYNQMLTIFFSCSFSLVHSSTMVRTAFNPAFQSFTWFLYNVQVKNVVELWAFWAEFIKKFLKSSKEHCCCIETWEVYFSVWYNIQSTKHIQHTSLEVTAQLLTLFRIWSKCKDLNRNLPFNSQCQENWLRPQRPKSVLGLAQWRRTSGFSSFTGSVGLWQSPWLGAALTPHPWKGRAPQLLCSLPTTVNTSQQTSNSPVLLLLPPTLLPQINLAASSEPCSQALGLNRLLEQNGKYADERKS